MELSKVIINVCRCLDKKGISYMLIGGQAVLVHGYARLTEDIDITLGLNISDSSKLLSLLPEINCKSLVKDPDDFIKTTWVLPVMDVTNNTRIDFTFSFSDYETNAINNAVVVNLEDEKIRFCSVNDLIIHKIFAGRVRDLDDVKNIYIKNKDKIDLKYINKWLIEFDSNTNDSANKKYVSVLNEIIKTL